MGSITRDNFNALVEAGDFDAILRLFDDDPSAVRRLLTRLTYSPDAAHHANAIQAFKMLSSQRATQKPEFFREIIRRHIWGMNEEGGNIDWSAPEIIAAVIAGSPELFHSFIPIMYNTAIAEPLFHDSLHAALQLIAEIHYNETDGHSEGRS